MAGSQMRFCAKAQISWGVLPFQSHSQACRRIAEKAEFFASVGEWIEDAGTSQRGDGDWFGEVQDFFDEVRSAWKTIEEREAAGAVRLNHDSPERYLAKVQPDQIGSMGLVEVLTLLRKAAARPEIEEYNWTCPVDQERKPDPERDQRFIDAYREGLIVPALHRLNALLKIQSRRYRGRFEPQAGL